jgi:lipopolysaccharide biosynthesis glycosyltransferase/predicted O-methyltransferase YrrM
MSLFTENQDLTPSSLPEQGYIFTPSQDWFTHNIPTWEPLIASLLSTLPSGRAPRALEVGSWEGRSAVYLLTTLCTSPASLLVCIDHFNLFHTTAGRERHAKILHNLRLTGSPFRVIDEFSVPGLMTILREETASPSSSGGFDFVYLDGSHEADDTLLDAELAWRLTRPGALFILDDYAWDKEPSTSVHHPARGIDTFLALHAGQFELLSKGYQVILRKTVDMRIGFLIKAPHAGTADDPLEGLDYGINVALCLDAAYAMPATVAIRSAVDKTPGRRITFYIVDCGLREEDRRKISESVPRSREEDVTLVFRMLPDGSRGLQDPTWAKADMLITTSVLPVERVLFLDADVLVRHDLGALWKTDLGGRFLGAARDIGHPLGHEGLPETEKGRPHFNAGVMLLDLTLIRTRLPAFAQLVRERAETTYKDQDLLNAFFALDDWLELNVEWNASGLGTYAVCPGKDRDVVWPGSELKALHADPAIVHFTGPVHPSMSGVLNEYVQPWTSKPWGYAGAPGNPFKDEWWDVLERTAWRGMRQDEGFLKDCAEAQTKAREKGIEEFDRRIKSAFLV